MENKPIFKIEYHLGVLKIIRLKKEKFGSFELYYANYNTATHHPYYGFRKIKLSEEKIKELREKDVVTLTHDDMGLRPNILGEAINNKGITMIWKFGYIVGVYRVYIRECFEWNKTGTDWESQDWNFYNIEGKALWIRLSQLGRKKRGNELIKEWQKDYKLKDLLKEERKERREYAR